MPPISSRSWNKKFSAQVEAEYAYRDNQRGLKRSSAQRPLGRRTRRVGKILKRNIARSLPFHWNPPGNESDVTQNGKRRQCASAMLWKFFANSGRRHFGVVDVDQAPGTLLLAIDLRLAAMSHDRRPVFSQLSREVPVELSPGAVAKRVHGDIMGA